MPDGVAYLDPESALLDAMLEGWARQQRSRFLREETITPRLNLVRRFATFTNEYPWAWQPADAEAFVDDLRTRRPNFAVSTARGYENALRLFCEFITDARYGWSMKCLDQFGHAPSQIMHEWNSIVHAGDYEGSSGRRPLTYDEVQLLFDAADAHVEEIRARRRKGARAAPNLAAARR